MSDRDKPWSKFYWADWESDNGLRQCSLAAQGLWMRMLCICARSESRGYLTIADVDLDVATLATTVSKSETEVSCLLEELERWRVFSRDRKGRIFSRRMIRDDKRSKEGAKFKKEALSKSHQAVDAKEQNSIPSRGAIRGASPQKPEARSQITPKAPSAGGDEGDGAKAICKKFLEERSRLWPDESALPAPTMTIKSIARQHLDAGGSVDLIIEVMARGMERMSKSGKTAPNSLAVFKNSIADAITQHKQSGSNGSSTSASVYVSASDRDDERQRTWIRLWKSSGHWPEDIRGPKPGSYGCRVRPEILAEFSN